MRPVEKASAVVYNERNDVPLILYNGVAEIADRMVQVAVENDIPVIYEPETAEVLSMCRAGDSIPAETWKVMAAVFAFIRSEK